MKLAGLCLIAICVLCGCQPAFAAKTLRRLRERAAGEAEGNAPEWKPENRDEWDRWDKDVHSYRWPLEDRDIEEVSYWFMEKLWWYLFGTDDVQVKAWWKLRKSFRNYLREWWLTTPWAAVGTLKTGVWYALSKLTFEELPTWWGGTVEYEKMKELLQDDEPVDRWTEHIQHRLICDKKRDPSRGWKPGSWDHLPEEDRWDWEDLEKKILWRGDAWWDKKDEKRPWDRPEGSWDWEGWDKERSRKRGTWDSKGGDGQWDWGDWEKKIRRRGDAGWDQKSWKKQGPWDKSRDGGRWDWREWKKNLRRRGDEGWDSRKWQKLFKRGRSGWTGRGPWDHPYLDWRGDGWSWDGRWEGRGGGESNPWRRTWWGDEGKWDWKPWKKGRKEAADMWEPNGRPAWKGDKWDWSGWKGMGASNLGDTASSNADQDDERGWKEKWDVGQKVGPKPWKK